MSNIQYEYEPQPKFIQRMRAADPENNICVDCGDPNPEWASMNNGVARTSQTGTVRYSLATCTDFHLLRVLRPSPSSWVRPQRSVAPIPRSEQCNRVCQVSHQLRALSGDGQLDIHAATSAPPFSHVSAYSRRDWQVMELGGNSKLIAFLREGEHYKDPQA